MLEEYPDQTEASSKNPGLPSDCGKCNDSTVLFMLRRAGERQVHLVGSVAND